MFNNSQYQMYTSVFQKKTDIISIPDYGTNHICTSTPPAPLGDDYYFCHYLYYKSPSTDNMDFSNFYLGLERNPPQKIINKYQSNSCVIYFILDGEGTFNGTKFGARSFFYVKPYQQFYITGDWYAAWMVIDNKCATKLHELLKVRTIDQMSTFYDIQGIEKLFSFYLYSFSHLYNSPRLFSSLVWQSISFLDSDMPIVSSNDSSLDSQIKNKILRAVAYINDNISTVTVSKLAYITSYEVKYFSYLFNKVMGTSPKQYILSRKMDSAIYYLCHTDYSIEKIMDILGYSHRNSFTSIFKKTYGVSPQNYRESHHYDTK